MVKATCTTITVKQSSSIVTCLTLQNCTKLYDNMYLQIPNCNWWSRVVNCLFYILSLFKYCYGGIAFTLLHVATFDWDHASTSESVQYIVYSNNYWISNYVWYVWEEGLCDISDLSANKKGRTEHKKWLQQTTFGDALLPTNDLLVLKPRGCVCYSNIMNTNNG